MKAFTQHTGTGMLATRLTGYRDGVARRQGQPVGDHHRRVEPESREEGVLLRVAPEPRRGANR